MYKINRILVGLDISSGDKALIQYASQLTHIVGVNRVYFIHIANDLDLHADLVEKYPDLLAPIDENLRNQIDFNIKKYHNFAAGVEYDIIIDEGNTKKQILKYIKQKDIDILVIGRKSNKIAELGLVKNLVRIAPCSVAVIPETIPETLRKIAVPLDFSENSFMTLEVAEKLAEKFKSLKIEGFNIYEVPQGYSKTGKSYEEFKEIMRENAKKEAENFIKLHGLNLENLNVTYQCNDNDDSIAESIYYFAKKIDADGIVIGSKGRNAFSSLLIGSMAEHLIDYVRSRPLLIIKEKREAMNLLEALKQI